MITYQFKKLFFKITEILGRDQYNIQELDIKSDVFLCLDLLVSHKEVANYVNSRKSVSLLEPNYLLDLRMGEEELFNKIHKNTRYKIKRAANRDQLTYVELNAPTDMQIDEFCNFFNPFAIKRNIQTCNVDKLKAIRDQNKLVISYIKNSLNRVLCYHVYFYNEVQGYLLYSSSRRFEEDSFHDRNLIGRANRYLHWLDIISFKKKGCIWYNFGGKITNQEDKEGQNVNKFKSAFGATNGFDLRIYYSRNKVGGIFLLLLKMKLLLKKNRGYLYALQFKDNKNELSNNAEMDPYSHKT